MSYVETYLPVLQCLIIKGFEFFPCCSCGAGRNGRISGGAVAGGAYGAPFQVAKIATGWSSPRHSLHKPHGHLTMMRLAASLHLSCYIAAWVGSLEIFVRIWCGMSAITASHETNMLKRFSYMGCRVVNDFF